MVDETLVKHLMALEDITEKIEFHLKILISIILVIELVEIDYLA